MVIFATVFISQMFLVNFAVWAKLGRKGKVVAVDGMRYGPWGDKL